MAAAALLVSLGALGSATNPLHANVSCVFEHDIDHKYNDIRQVDVSPSNTSACCSLCKAEPQCGMWVLSPGTKGPYTKCWLKENYGKLGTQWVRSPDRIAMCTNPTAGAGFPSHFCITAQPAPDQTA